MPRLTPIEPESAEGRAKELFEGPLQGKSFNFYKGMINSPAALSGFMGLSAGLATGEFTAREREVFQLAVAQFNGCAYCLGLHTALGLNVGLTIEQTIQARQGTVEDERLAALVSLARAMHEKRGQLDDEDVESFRDAGFGDSHLVEAVGHYALATMSNYFNHLNETVLDFNPAPEI